MVAVAAIADSALTEPGRHLCYIYVCELGEDKAERQVTHAWFVLLGPLLDVSVTCFRH